MKKVYAIIVSLMIIIFTGCGKEEEIPKESFTITGTFAGYQELVDEQSKSYILTLDCNGEFVDFIFSSSIPQANELTSEYVIEVTGEKDDVAYYANIMTVVSVPLYIEVGCTGEELLSNTMEEYNYRSTLAQVSVLFERTERGRVHKFGIDSSYYISQDENATYYNLVRVDDKEDGSSESTSVTIYADRLTGDWYKLVDYGMWEANTGYKSENISLALNSGVTVDRFERVGDELVVSGSVDGNSINSYLDYILADTLGDLYLKDEMYFSYEAKFKESSRELVYIEFLISYKEVLEIEGSTYSAKEVKVVMNGIEFNNTTSVVIPGHVSNVVPEPTSEPVADIVPVCVSVFGVEPEAVTAEFIITVIGDVYTDDSVLETTSPDDVVTAAMNIMCVWTYEQLQQVDVSSCPIEEAVAVYKILEAVGTTSAE